MVLFEPKKELKTNHYLPYSQVMIQSSYWVDPCTGEKVKLSAGLKLYYAYRLQRYKYFSSQSDYYCETNDSCAKALGIGLSSITNKHNALLKRMGLLEVIRLNPNDKDDRYYHFDVKEVKDCLGWFINPDLKDLGFKVKTYQGDKIDYSQLKNLEHNKKIADSVRYNKNEKVYLMSDKERKEYLQLKRELKSINE